jgi:flagellar assembly protein FliH
MTLSEARDGVPGWEPPSLAPRCTAAAPPPEQDIERLRREAFDTGYAEGIAAGRARAESIVGELSVLLEALATPFRATDATLVRELVGLVERTAQAVVGRELDAGNYDFEGALAEALAVLGSVSVPVEVHMNPADVALCREHGLALPPTASLCKDAALRRGGLRLQAGHRIVDASIERRLDEVLGSLRDDAGVPDPVTPSGGDEKADDPG